MSFSGLAFPSNSAPPPSAFNGFSSGGGVGGMPIAMGPPMSNTMGMGMGMGMNGNVMNVNGAGMGMPMGMPMGGAPAGVNAFSSSLPLSSDSNFPSQIPMGAGGSGGFANQPFSTPSYSGFSSSSSAGSITIPISSPSPSPNIFTPSQGSMSPGPTISVPISSAAPQPQAVAPPSSMATSAPAAPGLFVCFVPGRPPLTDFVAVDATLKKYSLALPSAASIPSLTLSLLQPQLLPPQLGLGVGIYVALEPFREWKYVGAITGSYCTAIVDSPWRHQAIADNVSAQLGLSVEPMDYLRSQQEQLKGSTDPTALIAVSSASVASPSSSSSSSMMEDTVKFLDDAKGIAGDLYEFMASYSKSGKYQHLGGDVLVIPTNIIDGWYQKFHTKHMRDPFFWRRKDQPR